jgi:hypothetical protein
MPATTVLNGTVIQIGSLIVKNLGMQRKQSDVADQG